ncbi:MAG TPA: hypothetical protein VGF13_03180 [Verrucomicrobiae bacterium]|jgi:hypothetical protein
MKADSLKQFIALRTALTQEKAQLESRLAEINRVLGAASGSAPRNITAPARGRAANALSLREAVAQVTKDKALTKGQILQAIEKIGYKFTARDPMNSLNVTLYTPGNFKNNGDGTFRVVKK